MEQIVFSIACILFLALYIFSLRGRTSLSLLDAIVLANSGVVLSMSHIWHLIWGEGRIADTCLDSEKWLGAWKCVDDITFDFLTDSYEFTVVLEVFVLSIMGWYIMNSLTVYSSRVKLAIVLGYILSIVAATLLFVFPPSWTTDFYIVWFNWASLALSFLISVMIYFGAEKADQKRIVSV